MPYWHQNIIYWLLVKVLHPTRHKIGHFGDVPCCFQDLHETNLLPWYGKYRT